MYALHVISHRVGTLAHLEHGADPSVSQVLLATARP